ncbi:MAG: DUF4834 family protein [Candidatus Delongbacteria bacterium]|jgi:sortase (surface protein transpeptidase)|nr:DUF4834 family protein [Candidatus Delongbacteria bacterium]
MKFILIVIIGILFFRLLFRFVIPWLLKRKINKMQHQYKQEQDTRNKQDKSEGEVTIQNIPEDRKSGKKKGTKHDDEEYSDYEEID